MAQLENDPLHRQRGGVLRRLALLSRRIPFGLKLFVLGVICMFLTVILQAFGMLDWLERSAYDARVRHCGAKKSPTTQFVHLDIDDTSIELFGSWPWPRSIMAEAIRELVDAEARMIVLDIRHPERNAARITGDAQAIEEAVERDTKRLAEALAYARSRGVKVLIPVSYDWDLRGREDELRRAAIEECIKLLRDTQPNDSAPIAPQDVAGRLAGRWSAPELQDVVIEDFMSIHRAALLKMAVAGSEHPEIDVDTKSKARSLRELRRHFPTSRQPDSLLEAKTVQTEPEPVSAEAGGYGFVSYVPDRDGAARAAPLLVHEHDYLVPQLALAAACVELGVDPARGGVQMKDGVIHLTGASGNRRIPVHPVTFNRGSPAVDGNFLIPWPAPAQRDWQLVMGADVPHILFARLRPLIAARHHELLQCLNPLREKLELTRIESLPPPLRRMRVRLGPLRLRINVAGLLVQQTLNRIEEDSSLNAARTRQRMAQSKPGHKNFAEELQQAKEHLALIDTLTALLDLQRGTREASEDVVLTCERSLRQQVAGKPVFIGYVYTGSVSDVVPTSLHTRCPGVVIHGVIYNAIMTGSFWTRASRAIDLLATVAVGLAATWVMVRGAPRTPSKARRGWLRRYLDFRLSPWMATLIGVACILGWIAYNAFYLFGAKRYVVEIAPPVVAALLIWAVGIAAIASERFRATQLLRGYIDPKLSEFLSRNPKSDLFDPKARRITVCFTDLAGFTTLSQRLEEKIVPVLQEYLTRMVRVIRRNGGIVDKFIGDGIMFLFGVPDRQDDHAARALRCVMEMQQELARFNEKAIPPELNLVLKMRCGVNTGKAHVGNAGPEDACEYTALGDAVNLAARLEAVNKECKTFILLSEDTRLEAGDREFFYLPVGRLKLRGRTGVVETYQLVGVGEEPKDFRDRRQVLLGIISDYQLCDFPACINKVAQFKQRFGEDALCELYRLRSEDALKSGVKDFEGQIVEQA